MTKKVYRVKVRSVGFQTFEIEAETEDEARLFCGEGRLVYDDLDYEDIESVTQIDVAEAGA